MTDKISNRAQASRMAFAAVLAALFSGSAMAVAASALGMAIPGAAVYLSALVAVALGGVGMLSGPGALLAALGFAAVTVAYALGNAAGFGALKALFAVWSGREADATQAALGARTLLTCGAFTCGALFFALLNRRELVSLAITIELSMLVACHAMSETASLGAAVPGLIALAAAFALTGGIQRNLSALRVLLPAALAAALALAVLPGQGTTWQPLEEAASRVRNIFEQYFRFTHERIAFSINEEGYDHAGEVGDSVVSMLGGPASPHTDPVMRVRTDADVLLRGAIRTAYTGYSWVDAAPKSRYLYFDLTHRAIRERVFTPPAALKDALLAVDVSVEMLDEGTSTLFVPGLLQRFEMDLSTAVYYNTAGEVFLSRDVRAGDRYSLRALLPEMNDALRQAVIDSAGADDARYQEVLANHTQLPEGIEGGVYALTMQVIEGADTPYDRAVAIMNYLRREMRYTLTPQVPPRGRDFASFFLLDSREGYCSYYATAMAVMGRMAGLPTRYVEGYMARPGTEVLTGENAHAWAEVYFRGIGWIPFDATGGTTGSGAQSDPPPMGESPQGDAGNREDGGGAEGEADYDGSQAGAPTPSLPPDDGAQADEPTPSPDPGEDPTGQDEPSPEPEADDTPDDGVPAPEGKSGASGGWIWAALLLLAALAALGIRWIRRRLAQSDPALLCRKTRSAREAAMIAYRANLTLLSCLGQSPAGGEAPEAFASRVSAALKNPDFADFARAVANARYGGRPVLRSDVETGLKAYRGFMSALGHRERLRFTVTRVLRGLGDFESIP